MKKSKPPKREGEQMAAQVVPLRGLRKALGRIGRDERNPVLTRINDELFEVYRQGVVTSITSDEIGDIELATEAATHLIAFFEETRPRRSLDDILGKYGITREELDAEDVEG